MNEHLRPTLRYMPRDGGDFFDRRKLYRRNGWSLGGAVAAAVIAGIGMALIAIMWVW